MTFSQSFEFGNSTLMNLETEVKRAIGGKVEDLDIIVESPTKTNSVAPTSFSTRSRFLGCTYSSRNTSSSRSNDDLKRRRFRRSKSDSTLEAKKEAPPDVDNYSEFFRSDFTFSNTEKVDKGSEKEEASMISASLIEAALDAQDAAVAAASELPLEADTDISSSALDEPIFSEDVKQFLQTEEAEEGMNLEDAWQDSLPLSVLPTESAISKQGEVTQTRAQDDQQLDDCAALLDASSFICPGRACEAAQQQLSAQLESSRRVVLASEGGTVPPPRTTSQRCVNVSLSYMSPEQLTWSANTPTEPILESHRVVVVPPSLPEKTAIPVDEKVMRLHNLDSLTRIDAWNLPRSVLQEYEKKGVIKMFDWQIECLSNPKVLFEHSNLVYSAPTSAGKTLVSEILLLKTVLERGKKVLLILPFISVVREKMLYLQDLLTSAGYRVEGFFGGYTPPGGFESIHVAICTIEKANSIVNKLLEQGKLDEIGTVVVDEVHLISDPGRGYILELLLAKILYMSRKYALQIQVITMSATLANVELLQRWLDAELFITQFRPVALQEMIKVGSKIYDSKMSFLRDVTQPLAGEQERFPALPNDGDHVAQLCIETLLEGCSVVVFCPSKDWCENLAVQLAGAIHALGKGGSAWGIRLREKLNREAIDEVKRQLRDIPTGLDSVLEKTITFACAFHHAGLTTEERDIVEASFKSGALKIIVATSTLSSGVNLPARRVLIRSPLFGGKQMSSLTYRQMIGRAGRTGKDTLGESILVCTDSNARIGRELIIADLKPISSCLELDSSTHLKRALLEVISSGVASTKEDLEHFVNCTLLSVQKQLCGHTEKQKNTSQNIEDEDYINKALNFLIEYEFVRQQVDVETQAEKYVATRLGMACLASSMPPTDGLILFAELQKSRRCFVLESELHAVYLVTPYSVCYQMQDLDWLLFLDLWEKLTPAMRKVGELVGVKESFLVRAMRGQMKLDYQLMQIHKRFYTALALQELVNETPISTVANKYKCTRGMLQGLQQMASTFAGIVTAFCNSLQWSTLSLIVSQFKERLYFGIHRDLIDLMRLPDLSHKRARALFDGGIQSLVELAQTDALVVQKILFDALSFDSAKQHDNENEFEAEQRRKVRNFFITGKAGLTVGEAAKLLVQESRQFVQYEIGVGNINWSQPKANEATEEIKQQQELHMSCEDGKFANAGEKRISIESAGGTPPKMRKFNGLVVEELKLVTSVANPNKTSENGIVEIKKMVEPTELTNLKINLKTNSQKNFENTKSEVISNKIEQTGDQIKMSKTPQGFSNKSKVMLTSTNLEINKIVQLNDKIAISKTSEIIYNKPKDMLIETNLEKEFSIARNVANSPVTTPKLVEIKTESVKSKLAETDEKPSTSQEALRLLKQREIQEAKRNERLAKAQKAKAEFMNLKNQFEANTKNKDNIANNAAKLLKNKATAETKQKLSTLNNEEITETQNVNIYIAASAENNIKTANMQTLQNNSSIKNLATNSNKENLNSKTKMPINVAESAKLEKVDIEQEKLVEKVKKSGHSTRYALRRSQENIKNHTAQKNSPTPATVAADDKNTPKSVRNATQTENFNAKPRRSPRNNMPSSVRHDNKISNSTAKVPSLNKSNNIEELFMDDESFQLNTGIANALTAADNLHLKQPQTALNCSNDEIPSSQQLDEVAIDSPHASRFLRSYRTQRTVSPKRQLDEQKHSVHPTMQTAPVQLAAPPSSSTIELSDLSMENSLIKNPIQLNASHILSCSKVDTDASSFKSVEMLDICGDQALFKGAFKELMAAKRFGFCLGLQQQTGTHKPLIGANLLLNQVGAADAQAAARSKSLFQIDDVVYLACVAFCISENVVFFMNMQQEGSCRGLSAEVKCKYLRMLLRSKEHTLLAFDVKEQLKALRKALPDLGEICLALEDPKVGNWLLQPDKAFCLQQMTQQFAPECTALVNLCGSGRGYNSFGLDVNSAILAKVRCSIEACVSVHILKGQIENLERIGSGQLYKFFSELEMPLQLSLCNMETFGFSASESALRKLFQQMLDTMKKLEMKIYEINGSRFNLGSTSAVARVLGLHRRANGRFSTSKQILEKIDSPISQLIVAYRKLNVTLSKNIQPLLKCVRHDRIYGQSITFTATGRVSMTEPNLQNVAKDFDVDLSAAEKMTISCRSAFFPTDTKRCLISSDFCQLEMRILAHLSQDISLLEVMNSEQDVFTAIAARWNKIAEERVSEQLRNGTKQICYGIVYGMGMRSLAEALKCTEQEASMVSQQFHAAYPGIRTYAEKVIKFARSNGYVETITGRRRYLDHINSGEPLMKSQAERQAINSTIQGSAADIAKSAILRMEKNITKYRAKLGIEENAVRLVLHLHDELMFEVPEEKARKIAKILAITMENCVKLQVPLKVKLKIGRSWGELKEVKL